MGPLAFSPPQARPPPRGAGAPLHRTGFLQWLVNPTSPPPSPVDPLLGPSRRLFLKTSDFLCLFRFPPDPSTQDGGGDGRASAASLSSPGSLPPPPGEGDGATVQGALSSVRWFRRWLTHCGPGERGVLAILPPPFGVGWVSVRTPPELAKKPGLEALVRALESPSYDFLKACLRRRPGPPPRGGVGPSPVGGISRKGDGNRSCSNCHPVLTSKHKSAQAVTSSLILMPTSP